MRLLKFLNEKSIVVDTNFLKPVFNKVAQTCFYKPSSTVLKILNDLFAPFEIKFEPTNRKPSADTWRYEVGLNYSDIDSLPPFPITVYFDDLEVFNEPEYFPLWKDGVIRLIGHELVHRKQYSRSNLIRKVKALKTRRGYLGNDREIMALAHDVYCYLQAKWMQSKDFGPTLPKEEFIKRALREPLDLDDFSNLEEFLELFPAGSKERNRFMKQLYDYFTQQ